MLTNNHKITSLAYEDIVSQLSEKYEITPEVARTVVKDLSFLEYNSLLEQNGGPAIGTVKPGMYPQVQQVSQTASSDTLKRKQKELAADIEDVKTEDIIPPSEQTPGNPQVNSPSSQQQGSTQVNWAGNDTPIQQGMQVGLKDPQTGMAMPHEVVQVDPSTKGVILKDPQTGQQQSYNQGDLVPIASNSNSSNTNSQSSTQPVVPTSGQQLNQSFDHGDNEIKRILELAGIKENGSGGCSAGGMASGATTAGNIASVAAPLGKIKKRTPQAEESGNGTIHGKIDPNAATGELSRRLADAKMKTASRKNNGKKVT
jgi:hypothetical protein